MDTIKELMQTDDQYKVIGMSTAHILPEDGKRLIELARKGHPMMAPRATGAFVKLYPDNPEDDSPRKLEKDYPGFTDAFYGALRMAKKAGFRMVEFDQDATIHEGIVTFDW